MDATDAQMQWWREARFGMFIHWGLYAVPAGIWQGKEMAGIGEWIMNFFKIPLAEYRELAKDFNPVDFDADFIARLAAEAGVKYLVITAKHHDGFAMWDSQVSDYNIVKATPFDRDPLAELAEACPRYGVRLCFYYSQDLDWEHPDGTGNDWDYDDDEKDFGRYLEVKVKPQLRELLTNYGPVGLIWCDVPAKISKAQSLDLKAFIKSLQPDCLVSGRIGHNVGDYGSLGDNQIPIGGLDGDWEVPATLNDTWGFKTNDHNWKSTDTLLQLLIDLAGKGVNYLLNIGPDARGRVPEPSVDRLREMGAWVAANGEAIYGTEAGPFPYEFPWGRVTRKGQRLYLIVTEATDGAIPVTGLRTPVTGAHALADGTELTHEQEHDTAADIHLLHVGQPAAAEHPYVIVLELAADPDVDPLPVQQADGAVALPAHLASLHVDRANAVAAGAADDDPAKAGEAANQVAADSMRVAPGGLIENWQSTADWAAWQFRLGTAGTYEVWVDTVARKYQDWVGGHEVTVAVDGQELAGPITPDIDIRNTRTYHYETRGTRLGVVRLDETGVRRLSLRAASINPDDPAGLCLRAIRLLPA